MSGKDEDEQPILSLKWSQTVVFLGALELPHRCLRSCLGCVCVFVCVCLFQVPPSAPEGWEERKLRAFHPYSNWTRGGVWPSRATVGEVEEDQAEECPLSETAGVHKDFFKKKESKVENCFKAENLLS